MFRSPIEVTGQQFLFSVWCRLDLFTLSPALDNEFPLATSMDAY